MPAKATTNWIGILNIDHRAKLEADVGAEYVFPDIDAESNLRTTLEKIIKRAGVKQWPKLWQNLRASGSTDLARTLPGHVAAAICGHSEEIAREFYWTVSDDDLNAASETRIGSNCPPDDPNGAPIQGQIEALCGNSIDGGKISEECFDQGKDTPGSFWRFWAREE